MKVSSKTSDSMLYRASAGVKSSLLVLLVAIAVVCIPASFILLPSGEVAKAQAGPVAYWHMNEASWSGVSFDVMDSSGNANHGKAMGGADTTVGGINGSAGLFDGIDDYVLIPNSASLNIAGDKLTVEAWVKWNVNPQDWASQGSYYRWAHIVNKKDNNEWQLQHDKNNNRFEFGIRTINGGKWVKGTTVPQQGEWYHVVGVYDGAHIHIYVNGQLENSKSRSGNLLVSSSDVNIGRTTTESKGRYFPGLIDEVRIYDRALTPTEIQDHYVNDPSVEPCLTIDKDVLTDTTIVCADGPVTYQIRVDSTGGSDAENTYISDALPSGFNYTSTDNITLTGEATRISLDDDFSDLSNPYWGNFTIPSGGSVTIDFTVDIAANVTEATYDNNAYVWYDWGQIELDDDGAVAQDSDTPAGEDPEDDEDVTVHGPHWGFDKDTLTPGVVPGDQATYQIQLVKLFRVAANGTYIRDELPAGFTYNSTDSIIYTGNATRTSDDDDFSDLSKPYWGNFTIPEGTGSITVTFTVDVAETITEGTYNNTAYFYCTIVGKEHPDDGEVAQDEHAPAGQDPVDDEDVTVLDEDVSIDKDVVTDPAVVQAGGQVTYQISIAHNDPSCTEAGLYIWDGLPDGFTYNSTYSITETGGATRTSVDNPVPGLPEPMWGLWTISGVGSITIEFTVDIADTVTEATYDNTAYAWHPTISHDHDDDGAVAQDDDTPPGEDPAEDEDVSVLPHGCEEVAPATSTGTSRLCASSGTMENLTAVSESTLPTEGKPNLQFPHGFFSFNVTGLTPGVGETVSVTITLPYALPAGSQYWKYHPSQGGWIQIPMGSNDGDNVITITLVDGGLGDDDAVADGTIVDQGGPGNPSVCEVPASPSLLVSLAAFSAGVALYAFWKRMVSQKI